ncbi:methyltransferase domain-containing protein [Ditylenchus destructor]|nr:methyltransferase domain-containing protein [Ditylenchus destructor]
MSSIFGQFIKPVVRSVGNLRSQYRCPTESPIILSHIEQWSRETKPLVSSAIRELNVHPDHNILEVGYGRGDGLGMVYSIIRQGKGTITGLEVSKFMQELATMRLSVVLARDRDNKLLFDTMPADLPYLPYTNEFFDGIYHVDVFYFWQAHHMKEMCEELCRVLKPGKKMTCAMEMNRLRRLVRDGLLYTWQIEPLRYLDHLELAGFVNVKVDYKRINADGRPSTDTNAREIQLISAEKPENAQESTIDPEVVLKQLELDLKTERMTELMYETQTHIHKSAVDKEEPEHDNEMIRRPGSKFRKTD